MRVEKYNLSTRKRLRFFFSLLGVIYEMLMMSKFYACLTHHRLHCFYSLASLIELLLQEGKSSKWFNI